MLFKRLLLSTLLVQSALATGPNVNVQDRIETQKIFLNNYSTLFGNRDFARSEDFITIVQELPKRKRKKVLAFISELDGVLPEKILMPLTYWRFIKKDKKNVSSVLSYYMTSKAMSLRDYKDNPLNDRVGKDKAQAILQSFTTENVNSFNLSETVFPILIEKGNILSKISDDKALIKAIKSTGIIISDYRKEIPGLRPYSLSFLGLIPGNKVELISENKIGLDRIEWFNDRVIFNGGKLDFNSPYIKMPTKEDPSGNIVFKEDPIYMKIRDMIDDAEDSIFIDIFLFGGTLGATLTEYLIDETLKKRKKNPKFKTLLLHDYATNYNMLGEMMPIFEYIKKRRDSDPEVAKSVMLMQANIQRHPPGIPFGITNLIPKNDHTFRYFEKKSTYFESKIDHSKVIVIDANTDKPAAYFGSKNWTDHSGGYYYDDAIYVEGPAAALVQASYYRDVEAALTLNKKEQKWFYYKEKGLDNKDYLSKREEILNWFKIKKSHYPRLGDDTLRIAEADVDGRIKNVRNILVDMIANAKSHIYMEQLFIYDPYIVDALIKRKLQVPALEIKILADHNGNFGMNGLPNTLFIKELTSFEGIEVKARRTYGIPFVFPNGVSKEFHQENHRKITSVDGKVLLGGSSNLNPDTLQGSFREFGAQIFSQKEIERFERDFMKAWHDDSKTMSLDIENFQAIIGGKTLSIEHSRLINGVGSTLFRNKDKLEKRH